MGIFGFVSFAMDDCHLDYLVLHHKIEKKNDNMPLYCKSFHYSVYK
jgi:hypothetical protein